MECIVDRYYTCTRFVQSIVLILTNSRIYVVVNTMAVLFGIFAATGDLFRLSLSVDFSKIKLLQLRF